MPDTGLVEGFLSAGVAGFSLLMLAVALAAWRRVGGVKMLALAGAFAVFVLKGLWAVSGALGAATGGAPESLAFLTFDFAVLVLLYFGTVR